MPLDRRNMRSKGLMDDVSWPGNYIYFSISGVWSLGQGMVGKETVKVGSGELREQSVPFRGVWTHS